MSTADPSLEVRLAAEEDDWKLYFKLPDLAENELWQKTPAELQRLRVALQHKSGGTTRINGLGLWPGSGTTIVYVDPTNQVSHVFTEGRWPWKVERWNRAAQQIPVGGAIFGQSSGATTTMRTRSRPLYIGRSAVYVAPQSAPAHQIISEADR